MPVLLVTRAAPEGVETKMTKSESIATTNIYLHHLGTAADRVGLERLNTSGAPGARESTKAESDSLETSRGPQRMCR